MPKPTCGSCRFLNAYRHHGKPVEQCARHAPAIHPRDGRSIMPLVPPTRWCGDYQPAPGTPLGGGSMHAEGCECLSCLCADQDGKKWAALGAKERRKLADADPVLAARLEANARAAEVRREVQP